MDATLQNAPDSTELEREIAIAATVEAVLERLDRRGGKSRWNSTAPAWAGAILLLLITAAGWLVGLGRLQASTEASNRAAQEAISTVRSAQDRQAVVLEQLTTAVGELRQAVAILQDRSEHGRGAGR